MKVSCKNIHKCRDGAASHWRLSACTNTPHWQTSPDTRRGSFASLAIHNLCRSLFITFKRLFADIGHRSTHSQASRQCFEAIVTIPTSGNMHVQLRWHACLHTEAKNTDMHVRPLAQHACRIAGDTTVSTYGVNMWPCSYGVYIYIYSTKEQCRQNRVERACEKYLLHWGPDNSTQRRCRCEMWYLHVHCCWWLV